MTNNEIKIECEKMYKQIKYSQNRINEIRDICKHEETEKCTYDYGFGKIFENTTICKFCQKVLKH